MSRKRYGNRKDQGPGGSNDSNTDKSSVGNLSCANESSVKTAEPQQVPSYKKKLEIAGFIISVLTLVAAGTAAYFAGDLAYTTWEAAEDAHTAYTATQRPFVTVKDLKVEYVDGLKPSNPGEPGIPVKYWTFTPVFENSGNTLTRNLRVYPFALFKSKPFGGVMIGAQQAIEVSLDSSVAVKTPEDPDSVKHEPGSDRNFVIGPHSSVQVGGTGLTADDLKPDSPSFFVFGTVHYDDTFPKTPSHKTKYCFVVSGIPSVGEQKPHFGLCTHWNCTDDECDADKNAYNAENSQSAKTK
jgi:hypothetical protein